MKQPKKRPIRPLTRKQKAFVKELVENPKQSATQAVLKTYDIKSYNAARNIASTNLTKPNIQMVLDNYGEEAVNTIYQIMKTDYTNSKSPADTRLNAAKDIADRVLGKPTQQIQMTSTGINITVDLTSTLQDN